MHRKVMLAPYSKPIAASPATPKARSPKLNSSELVNEIVEKIEIGILFGEYKPREHLVQDQLAERYGVERNIIRAALKKLEERSVIEHFPNRGSMVKEMTAKNAKDLYQLRFLLESSAAEMAVAHITLQIIRQLEALHEEMKKDLKKGELRGFTLAHEKFHQMIFETADNSYLLKAIKDLRSASASIRNFSYSRYSLTDTKNQLFDEHRRMINHLEEGKVEEGGQLARDHIKAGLNHYLRNFFPQESLID
ncbi:MAG: GntR family transcriptional regulator [Deltaproteobacteria bacterium]|nr:MAG: GntR family transcriptional regulator [Deltaproteobacteria bacterium]